MQQTLKPLETGYLSIQHVVARLIREHPEYQKDGTLDEPYLVEEARREWGSWIKASTITRLARKVRRLKTIINLTHNEQNIRNNISGSG